MRPERRRRPRVPRAGREVRTAAELRLAAAGARGEAVDLAPRPPEVEIDADVAHMVERRIHLPDELRSEPGMAHRDGARLAHGQRVLERQIGRVGPGPPAPNLPNLAGLADGVSTDLSEET